MKQILPKAKRKERENKDCGDYLFEYLSSFSVVNAHRARYSFRSLRDSHKSVTEGKHSQETMVTAKPRERSPHIWAKWGSPEERALPLVIQHLVLHLLSGSQFSHLSNGLIIPTWPQSQLCSETIVSLIDFIKQVSRKLEVLPTVQTQCQTLSGNAGIIKYCNPCAHSLASHSNVPSH